MKHTVLLIDESLTVQKVVSLTLDKNQFHVLFAKNRKDSIKMIIDINPEVVLVSDQMKDIEWSSFPKEVEVWLGRTHALPKIILIASHDVREAKHYAYVLKKPFTPLELKTSIENQVQLAPQDKKEEWSSEVAAFPSSPKEEDKDFKKAFDTAFSNEDVLVKETFESLEEDEKTIAYDIHSRPKKPLGLIQSNRNPLWELPTSKVEEAQLREGKRMPNENQILGPEDSMAYKAILESEVQSRLSKQNLDEIVGNVLERMIPPIVEKLVQERLDSLLKEQDMNHGMKDDLI